MNCVGSSDSTPGYSLFGAVKLVKNADTDKCKYSGYGIGFDGKQTLSFPTSGFGKNAIIFRVDMSSSVDVDNKNKDILVLGEGPTQRLRGTVLAAEKKYSINFTVPRKKFCLSLHYNGPNSYLFINSTETIKFKAKAFERNTIPLCLGSISKSVS